MWLTLYQKNVRSSVLSLHYIDIRGEHKMTIHGCRADGAHGKEFWIWTRENNSKRQRGGFFISVNMRLYANICFIFRYLEGDAQMSISLPLSDSTSEEGHEPLNPGERFNFGHSIGCWLTWEIDLFAPRVECQFWDSSNYWNGLNDRNLPESSLNMDK
jgi:hypothetical protein